MNGNEAPTLPNVRFAYLSATTNPWLYIFPFYHTRPRVQPPNTFPAPSKSVAPTTPTPTCPKLSQLAHRPRRLTLPLPPTPSRPTYTNPQRKARFLTALPLDIRYLIYDCVFHASNSDNANHSAKVIHIFAPAKDRAVRRQLAHSCASDEAAGLPVVFLPGTCAHHGKDGFLTLLLTCRVIYSEAIAHLYSTAMFLFFQPRVLLCFARMILPQRLNSICALRLEWERGFEAVGVDGSARIARAKREWSEVWEVIAEMKALRQLHVGLQRRAFGSMEMRGSIAEPMMGVRGLRVFEVLLPVDEEGEWGFLVDPPFTIVDRFSSAQ